jgi:hypothetical protein
MSYLDEARIEDKHVWRVTRDIIRDNPPFNRTLCGIDIAILIDIQPEFCKSDDERTAYRLRVYLDPILLS